MFKQSITIKLISAASFHFLMVTNQRYNFSAFAKASTLENFAKRKTKIIDEENRSILLLSMTEHSITRDKKHRKIIYVSRWGAFSILHLLHDVEKCLTRRMKRCDQIEMCQWKDDSAFDPKSYNLFINLSFNLCSLNVSYSTSINIDLVIDVCHISIYMSS